LWAKFGGLLAVLPCLWVLVCRLPRVKGLSAFLYTGLSRFLYGFRDLFAGLSAFFCVNADSSLAPFGRLFGYNYLNNHNSNYTGAIIPLVTITKVTIPCAIDGRYCLRVTIAKSN